MVINTNSQLTATDAQGDFKIDSTDRVAYANIITQLADKTNTKLDSVRAKLAEQGYLTEADITDRNGKSLIDFDGSKTRDSSNDLASFNRLAGSDGKLSPGDFLAKMNEDGLKNGAIEKAFYESIANAFKSGGTNMAPFLQSAELINNTAISIDQEQSSQTVRVGRSAWMNNDLKHGENYLFMQTPDIQVNGTIQNTQSSNGNVIKDLNIQWFGNSISFNSYEGKITVNGREHQLGGHNWNSQSAMNDLFQAAFADITPKPTINYTMGGKQGWQQAWSNFSIKSPDGKHKLDISMNTLGSHHAAYYGVGFTYTGPADSEGRGIVLDPHESRQTYSITENSDLLESNLLTAEEFDRSQLISILDSIEFEEFSNSVSAALANGSEEDLTQLLQNSSQFGEAGSQIRALIMAEILRRDAMSAASGSNQDKISLDSPKAQKLKENYPKEFTLAVVNLSQSVATSEIERLEELKENGSKDPNIDKLIESWTSFENYGQLLNDTYNPDSDYFSQSTGSQNSSYLETTISNALQIQSQIVDLINSGQSGASLDKLRNSLDTSLLSALTLTYDEDTAAAQNVFDDISSGNSPHSLLFSHSNSHIDSASSFSQSISTLENQLASLDPSSEEATVINNKLNVLRVLKQFAMDSKERDNQLKVNLALQLGLFEGRDDKIAELMALLASRNNAINEINTLAQVEPLDRNILKVATDTLTDTNKAINDLIRDVGGNIQAMRETGNVASLSGGRSSGGTSGDRSSFDRTNRRSNETLGDRTNRARDEVVSRFDRSAARNTNNDNEDRKVRTRTNRRSLRNSR